MLFSSFVFLVVFLPPVVALYWSARTVASRQWVLLAGSLVFYAYWFPPYLLLLLAMVGVAWAGAIAAAAPARWPAKAATVAVLLLVLGYYKYAAFAGTVAADAGLVDAAAARRWVHGWELPLGISFIAFQAIGYVVDVARREIPPERRYSTVLLFKAFFPQLIAGPICRGRELIPQLKAEHRFELRRFCSGLAVTGTGLALKVVFADNVAPFVDHWFAHAGSVNGVQSLAGGVGFAIQILADFWGYSTMAVGLAMLFGIDVPVNFRLPYLASSLRDFWRRWHVTLSNWLRDYLYKSLGGSRHGRVRTVLALMLTMVLGGLWHGANYTFLAWGALHGAVLTAEHLLAGRGGSRPPWLATAGRAANRIAMLATVLVGWIFFRADDLGQALALLAAPWRETGRLAELPREFVVLSVAFLVVHPHLDTVIGQLREGVRSVHFALAWTGLMLMIALVMSSRTNAPFIYFQF